MVPCNHSFDLSKSTSKLSRPRRLSLSKISNGLRLRDTEKLIRKSSRFVLACREDFEPSWEVIEVVVEYSITLLHSTRKSMDESQLGQRSLSYAKLFMTGMRLWQGPSIDVVSCCKDAYPVKTDNLALERTGNGVNSAQICPTAVCAQRRNRIVLLLQEILNDPSTQAV